MNSGLPGPPTVPHWVTAISVGLGLFGLAGLVLTCVLGFETPNAVLLATSGALTVGAPLAVLWHFAATRTLTTAEKRMWMGAFTGAEAWSALSEYMTSPDLKVSARRRAEHAAVRRAAKNRT